MLGETKQARYELIGTGLARGTGIKVSTEMVALMEKDVVNWRKVWKRFLPII